MNIKIGLPKFFIFIFISLFIVEVTFSQNWQFKKEEKGIRVYVRSLENSDNNLKELKITKMFRGDLNSIAAVLTDVSAYPNWVYKCAQAQTLKENSLWDIYFYSETKLPWPFQNRDVVLHSVMYMDDLGRLVSESKSVTGLEAKKKDIIRVPFLHSVWTFQPVGNGLIKMTYILNSEPGGNIPDWLVNLAVDEGPVQTVKKFLNLLGDKKYQLVNNETLSVPVGRQ